MPYATYASYVKHCPIKIPFVYDPMAQEKNVRSYLGWRIDMADDSSGSEPELTGMRPSSALVPPPRGIPVSALAQFSNHQHLFNLMDSWILSCWWICAAKAFNLESLIRPPGLARAQSSIVPSGGGSTAAPAKSTMEEGKGGKKGKAPSAEPAQTSEKTPQKKLNQAGSHAFSLYNVFANFGHMFLFVTRCCC